MKFRTSHFALALAGAALATGSVAIAGQNKMVGGAAMYPAKNIVEKGYPLTVTAHRNRAPVDDLLARGATEASLEDLAALADDPAARAAGRLLLEDEKTFITLPKSPLWWGEEKVIIDGAV